MRTNQTFTKGLVKGLNVTKSCFFTTNTELAVRSAYLDENVVQFFFFFFFCKIFFVKNHSSDSECCLTEKSDLNQAIVVGYLRQTQNL